MKTSINNKNVDIDSFSANAFYTAAHIDPRGRKYQPAIIGHQSGHDGKMATMFVASDASSASAIRAIKVNIARHFWDAEGNDIDKMSKADAIEIFNSQKEVMMVAVTNPSAFVMTHKFVASREQIEGFFKVAVSGFATINHGAESSMIIPFDGSCSGIQFASAITRDAEMAASVNIAGSVIRNDIYMDVVKSVIEIANSGDYSNEAVAIINNPAMFNRGSVKQAVMTMAYGSKFYAIMQDAFNNFTGVDSDVIIEIASIIEQARGEVTKPAMRMMDMFNIIHAATKGVSTFTHADGFVYSNAKAVYKKGYIVAGENNDKKGASAIAPDMIHSFDSAHVRAVINAADFDIVSIHDSFGCSPANADRMNIIIREEFIKMFSGDRNIIREFYEQNVHMMSAEDAEEVGNMVAAFQFGSLDISSVMDNEFAWS